MGLLSLGLLSLPTEITCSLPLLSTNTVLRIPQTIFKPSETASFECTPGNKLLTNHDTVTCQKDGTWDRSVPTCDPQKCGAPPLVDEGQPDSSNEEYNVGEILRYSCDIGYTLDQTGPNPTGAISCLPSGQWEENLPICQLVRCGDPPVVAHATYTGSERTFLSRVTYSCKPGYRLQGDDTVECVEDASWSPEPPSCTPVSCGAPPEIVNGQVRRVTYLWIV